MTRKTTKKVVGPIGPSIEIARQQLEEEKAIAASCIDDGEETIDISKYKVRDVQAMSPIPEQLDPFTDALLSGVDPMSAHQAMTLAYPILAFMGQNARVLYDDGTLRWMSGQSWQMGGSGCGKSLVLRSLEQMFLAREISEKDEAARKAAAYTLLSEKERKETSMPQEKVRILDTVPTALALLMQMQINEGGAMYLSCSECGEFGKKIRTPYYSLVLDMMKKSYDGTGEAYLHKASDKMYYVPSMKLCCNIGGTIDPMYRIFRQCDSDGTLSRGAVTILGERKNEETEGAYKAPKWTREQTAVLLEGAARLRGFDNRFNENDNDNNNNNDNDNDNDNNEESNRRAYEGAKDSDGNVPTLTEYNISVQEERVRLALSVPAIVAFGKEIKANLARIGEIADDCCSRANERAQAMCYLLYIANGLASIPEEERDARYDETLHRIIDVVRWWVNSSIDCAIAIQRQLNVNSKSYREEIRLAYKETMGASAAQNAQRERNDAFREYEAVHVGEIVSIKEAQEANDVFKTVSRKTFLSLVRQRGWRFVVNGKYRVIKKEK